MSTVGADGEAWKRFAAQVKARRTKLGLTQAEVVERSERLLSVPVLQVIEGAKRDRFKRRTLLGLARALEWTDDSPDLILAGGEPAARRDGDDVLEALDDIKAGLGRLERALAARRSEPNGR